MIRILGKIYLKECDFDRDEDIEEEEDLTIQPSLTSISEPDDTEF